MPTHTHTVVAYAVVWPLSTRYVVVVIVASLLINQRAYCLLLADWEKATGDQTHAPTASSKVQNLLLCNDSQHTSVHQHPHRFSQVVMPPWWLHVTAKHIFFLLLLRRIIGVSYTLVGGLSGRRRFLDDDAGMRIAPICWVTGVRPPSSRCAK